MRNLIGFLKKTLLIFSTLALLFSFLNKSHANEVLVYSDFHHVWDGNTINSTIYLTITSKTSSVLSSYIVSIPDTQITPTVLLINRNTTIEPTIHRSSSMTNITLDLKSVPLYPNKPVTLKLSYSTISNEKSLSLLSNIPDTKVRTFSLTYPTSLGDISWSSAPVNSVNTKGDKTEIITSTPKTDKVSISVGSEIVYRFKINKNLLNSSDETILSEIKLPLNNTYQHVIVESYVPQPDKAYRDIDGNYILQYSLAPLSTMDVVIEGYILMNRTQYGKSQALDIPPSNLWKISDTSLIRHINRYLANSGLALSDTFSSIEELEKEEERQILYTGIYKYIIDNLKPNVLTIGSLTGSERLGGQEILLKQDECTSEDYTDAIISIYRHYGIPARFVIGYISKISNYHSDGMYHYWAQYYDKDKNEWIIVDPFLDDYSNTSLLNRDLQDHISLIYRYTNPNLPKLPYYSAQEFEIEIENSTPQLNHKVETDFLPQPYSISDPYFSGSIYIKNVGNSIFDYIDIVQSNPDLSKYIDYIENNTQIILLPNQSHTIKFNIPSEKVVENIFASIDIHSGTYTIQNEYFEYDLEIVKDYKGLDILAKAISVLMFLLISIAVYLLLNKFKFKK